LNVADCVISMINYRPHDFTEKAKKIAKKFETERKREGGEYFGKIIEKIPLPWSIKKWKKNED